MKKIFTLLVMVALATCWMSCSDDDKNEPDPTIPTMDEIALTVKVNEHGKLELFHPELYVHPEFSDGERELEGMEQYLKAYHKIPDDWEVDWGDENTTNTTEHIYAKEGIYHVTIKGTGITSITPFECNYHGCYIQSIDVTKAPNLIILHISDAELSTLDISKNKALKFLDFSFNTLTSLNITNNLDLELLYCSENELSALDISKNIKLKALVCDCNILTSLDLSKNAKLTHLSCYENQLSLLNLSKNTELTHLECYNNQLTSLDLSKNMELEELTCSGNNLTSLELSKNTELIFLDCGVNQLTSLDLSKNTKLTDLDCGANELTSLDLSKNTELTDLYCRNNPFTQESVNNLLNSLPMGKYNNGEPISVLGIDRQWDVSIAEEKGWRINAW